MRSNMALNMYRSYQNYKEVPEESCKETDLISVSSIEFQVKLYFSLLHYIKKQTGEENKTQNYTKS